MTKALFCCAAGCGHVWPNWVNVILDDVQYKDGFLGMEISIIKIRESSDCLIFIMGIHIPVRRHLYIKIGPWFLTSPSHQQAILIFYNDNILVFLEINFQVHVALINYIKWIYISKSLHFNVNSLVLLIFIYEEICKFFSHWGWRMHIYLSVKYTIIGFGTKPLSEPVLAYCLLDPPEQI